MAKKTRVSYANIAKDCNTIKKLWSEAWTDRDIMDKIGLSSPQYKVRLKYIARDRFDTNRDVTLLQYQIKKQRRYDQLEALLHTTQDDKLKLECIQEMSKIDDGFVVMGQRLGIFNEEPKKIAGVIASVGVADIDETNISKDFKAFVIDRSKELIKGKFLLADGNTKKEKK